MADWDLFVDESGDFRPERNGSIVAGVLLRRDHPDLSRAEIEDLLRAAAPQIPWPPHARMAGFWPVHVAWVLPPETDPRPSDPDDPRIAQAKRLRELCCAAGRNLWLHVEGPVARNEAPDIGVLQRLDRACRARAGEWPGLPDLINQWQKDAQNGLDRLRAAVRALGRRLAPAQVLMAYAAGETRDGDALPPTGVPAPDRYATLLEGLVQRVLDSLVHRGDEHRLQIRVQGRSAVTRAQPLLHELNDRDLHEILVHVGCEAATRIYPTGRGWVQVQEAQVVRYDASAQPGDVIADLMAVRWRATLQLDHPLPVVLQAFEETGFPARSGPARLPHPAASGVAAAHVDQARALTGTTPETPAPPLDVRRLPGARPWALGQANLWSRHFAHHPADRRL